MQRTPEVIEWDCEHCEGFHGLHLCTAPSARFAHAVSDALPYIPASLRPRFLRTLAAHNADMRSAIADTWSGVA